MSKWLIGVIGVICFLSMLVIDTEEDKISDLEFELNNTKSELYTVNQSIAEGLCLPRLDTVKN
ncbi:MAG: hypothetical protein JHC33_05020 [Ignisphaera sp.]|nr:hypothetical protein [Ignisphaera sp.]